MKKEYDFSKAKRGPVIRGGANKSRITIRLDSDVLDWFRERVHESGGGSYQTLINQALRDHMSNRNSALEATMRRVVRQELVASAKRKAR